MENKKIDIVVFRIEEEEEKEEYSRIK